MTKYKIMVKKEGGLGITEPGIEDIRKKRFTSKKEADAFCEGINIYRKFTVVGRTTKFIAVRDGIGKEPEA